LEDKMSSEVEKKLSVKIEKTLENLKNELNTVRAGRANSALLDKIVVDYYSVPTPLKSLANISVPDPRTLLISPFDTKTVADIEKAINMSNIGITPSNDGKSIRLMIPQLTEERRKEISKTVKKYGEDAKVALRNERRTANDELKKEEKDGAVINGGFMVFEPEIFSYLDGDETILEQSPMQRLATEGKLSGYYHEGFWQCMDTQREKKLLEELWASGKAPWKRW